MNIFYSFTLGEDADILPIVTFLDWEKKGDFWLMGGKILSMMLRN